MADIIEERAGGLISIIIGCMPRGMEVVALESMEKPVQYAAFLDVGLGQCGGGQRQQGYNLFEREDWSGVGKETTENQKSLLGTTFGMSNYEQGEMER